MVASLLSSIPTSGRSKIHTCSALVKFEYKKTFILVSKGKSSSSSICVSARDTPGSDPVPIASDRGGVPGSSDSVSTAARRGDGSHCDDGLFFLARCSPIPSSGCTEFRVLDAVQGANTLSSGSFLEMPEIFPSVP